MKTGDEMFEELGYKKRKDTIFNIEKFVKTIGKTKYCIAFDHFCRRISVFTFEDRESRKDISMQELQAINKKCQELGWIEELDEECCETTTRTEFDLIWTCPNCKEENTEYGIPVETLMICTCENCNKKYGYYTQVY